MEGSKQKQSNLGKRQHADVERDDEKASKKSSQESKLKK